MVTRSQLDRLAARVEALAGQLGQRERRIVWVDCDVTAEEALARAGVGDDEDVILVRWGGPGSEDPCASLTSQHRDDG